MIALTECVVFQGAAPNDEHTTRIKTPEAAIDGRHDIQRCISLGSHFLRDFCDGSRERARGHRKTRTEGELRPHEKGRAASAGGKEEGAAASAKGKEGRTEAAAEARSAAACPEGRNRTSKGLSDHSGAGDGAGRNSENRPVRKDHE